MAIWLISLATSVLGTLPNPDLGVYYTLDTVNSFIDSIASQNSSVTTVAVADNGLKYIRLNTDQYPNNILPKVLFIGSIHGGFPQTTYTVLYYLDVLVNEYSTDDAVKYVVDTTEFIFLPVANKEAYEKVQELYSNSNSFTTIWTGLEGTDWNCTSNDYAGINPDKNFPTSFSVGSDKCTADGFTGDEALSSTTSQQISDMIESLKPDVVFNFDNQGGKIFYPLAGSTKNLTSEQNEYYTYADLRKGDYGYMNYTSYGLKNGSLLDYGNEKGSLVFEIWPANVTSATSASVKEAAEKLRDFLELAVQYHNVKASKGDLYIVESECDHHKKDCGYYVKNFTFTLNINSEHYSDYHCDIVINPRFNSSNVTLLETVLYDVSLIDKSTTDRSSSECTSSSSIVNCANVKISGFKQIVIKLTYGLPKDVEDDFDFVANITATDGYYPFYSLSFSSEDAKDQSGESDDGDGDGPGRRRRGVITGLVLLIVLLILLLIAGIILCCAQRNKIPEQPPQFGQANVV